MRHLIPAEGREDIIGRVTVERPADPDPDPCELAAAKLLLQRAEAVVAGMPAPFLELDLPERDIEVIMDNDEVLEGEPVEVEGRVHGPSGEVHERLGLEEEQALPPVIPLSIEAGKRLAGDGYSGNVGQPV